MFMKNRLLTNLFTLSVQSRSSLIQQENFGIPDQCSCNCYALLLTTAQLCSFAANVCCISLRQTGNSTLYLFILDPEYI